MLAPIEAPDITYVLSVNGSLYCYAVTATVAAEPKVLAKF